jgi:hypothetical protein
VGRSSIERRSVADTPSLCFARRVSEDARGGTAAVRFEPLEQEARVFSRYLVGQVAPDPLRARYVDAVRTLLGAPADAPDEAILAFVRRHAWSVSLLDAACALVRPGARLREKLLVMAAVLEASPDFAEEFLPRTRPPVVLFAQLAGLGCLAVGRAIAGLLLLPIAARP